MMLAVLLACGAFALSWFLTGRMRQFALRKQLLDMPNARSSHVGATPRGGGVAIALACSLLVAVLVALGQLSVTVGFALIGGGALVAIVGFLDDRHGLTPRTRLIAHVAAAVLAVAAIGAVKGMPMPSGVAAFGWMAIPLSLLALVWCINLYNFMDGIDGIAAVEMICVAIGALLAAKAAGAPLPPAPLLGVAAAAAGYLVWNWPPARIFMGDVGSGYLGYLVGIFTLATCTDGPLNAWVWLILFGVFAVDATYTVSVRLLRRETLSEAHRNHAYQKAARRFGGHRPVTLAVLAINLLWLWPLAAAAAAVPAWGAALSVIALGPLIAIEIVLGAGRPDLESIAKGSRD
jgi:Fuc2NAc and GlcNAc transferase